MKKRWWMGLAIGAVAVLVCLVPFFHLRNVYAVRSAYTIFRQQNTSIARGQVVDDALILGHNVNLSGHVYEILAVINGNVHVTSSGSADILVDLGGQIFLDHGAHVHQLYHLSLSTPFWNGVLLGGMFALLLWMGMLVLSMGLLLITTIVAWVFQEYTVVPFNILKIFGSHGGNCWFADDRNLSGCQWAFGRNTNSHSSCCSCCCVVRNCWDFGFICCCSLDRRFILARIQSETSRMGKSNDGLWSDVGFLQSSLDWSAFLLYLLADWNRDDSAMVRRSLEEARKTRKSDGILKGVFRNPLLFHAFFNGYLILSYRVEECFSSFVTAVVLGPNRKILAMKDESGKIHRENFHITFPEKIPMIIPPMTSVG